jgi:hypothetical protein
MQTRGRGDNQKGSEEGRKLLWLNGSVVPAGLSPVETYDHDHEYAWENEIKRVEDTENAFQRKKTDNETRSVIHFNLYSVPTVARLRAYSETFLM